MMFLAEINSTMILELLVIVGSIVVALLSAKGKHSKAKQLQTVVDVVESIHERVGPEAAREVKLAIQDKATEDGTQPEIRKEADKAKTRRLQRLARPEDMRNLGTELGGLGDPPSSDPE